MDEQVRVSLRKGPMPTPPKATAPTGDITHLTADGITGQLPLPDQPFVDPKSLTPAERAVWEKGGWRPGDPIPVPQKDLPASYAAAVEEIQRETRSGFVPPAPLNTPPLSVPDPIQIEDLPAEHQAELRAALAAASQQQARLNAQIPGVDPSINAAIRGDGVKVVDDRPVKAATKAAAKAAEAADETLADEPKKCLHCGWPCDVDDPIEVTDEDIRLYLLSTHGPLFQKEYKIHSGYTVVRIRELTPKEVDLCHLQAHKEVLREEISVFDYKERVFRLRCCLQLVGMEFSDGVKTRLPERVADYDVDPDPNNTPMRAICDYVYENVLRSEGMHRTVAHLVAKFNGLKARLEARAEDPDFYKRTDSPRS